MWEIDLQRSGSGSPSFGGEQQQPLSQIPDHLKCGELYTWLCAGELYAVECHLCDDHPLCPLSEFPQHMDIWHTEWQEMFPKTHGCASFIEEELQFLKEINADNLTLTTEDSGLFETDDQSCSAREAKIQAEFEEIPEPFEQVLIEQDVAVDSTIQISEELNEEEYFNAVNEAAAAAAATGRQFPIGNWQQQTQTFAKQNLTLANREPAQEHLTVKESTVLSLLTDWGKSRLKGGLSPAETFVNKQQHLNEKMRIKQQHDENIGNDRESETSGSGTNYKNKITGSKMDKNLRKFKPKKNKNFQQKYSKLNEIKRAINRIIKDASDFKETDQTESETEITRANENCKRNLRSKFSTRRQNFLNFMESEQRFVTENEINFLSKKNHLNTKNILNKTVGKIDKKYVKKFKNMRKSKRILRKTNQIQFKQTSAETDVETKSTKQNGNETLGQSKCSENFAECQEVNSKSSKNIAKINESKKGMNLNMKQTCSLANEEEPKENKVETYKSETYLKENEVEMNKNEKELQKNEMEQNGKAGKQIENEMKQSEIETKLIENQKKEYENTPRNIKNKIDLMKQQKSNGIEQNLNRIETIESETSFMIPNCPEIEANADKYLTKNRTCKLKKGETKTNGNEKNLTKLNFCEKGEDKNEKSLNEIKSQSDDHFEETTRNETNDTLCIECLRTSPQTRRKTGKYSKRMLRLKSDVAQAGTNESEKLATSFAVSQVTGTNENETLNKTIRQSSRKSQRTVEHLMKMKAIKQIKANDKGTNGSETLKHGKILQLNENETLLKELRSGTSSITNEINCEISLGAEIAQGICENETEQVVFSQETRKIELFENNVNEHRTKNEMEYLGQPRTNLENGINESDVLSSAITTETNENETLVEHNNKTKPFANVKATPGSESLLQNIRNNGKYLEHSMQSEKIEKANGNETPQLGKEDLNQFFSHPENAMDLKQFKANDLKSPKKAEELEINEHHACAKDKVLKTDAPTSCKKDLKQFGKDKPAKNELERRFGKSKNLSSTKQNRYLSRRNFIRKNLRSNKSKQESQQVLGNLTKLRRKYSGRHLYQAAKPRARSSDSVANSVIYGKNPHYTELKEMSVLGLTTEKEQEETNSFPSDITVSKEISISEKESDQRTALEERNLIEVCQAEGASAEGENSASAKESDEVNAAKQTDFKTVCLENKATTAALSSSGDHNAPIAYATPLSPLSPKTEEEHFEFYEPKEKLHKKHISRLIQLYHGHPRLWDQSHPDFCEPQMCRTSWQQITEEWNKYCQRKFTIAEVRIRVCTLCQRFVQEKDRLALEGELDECAKFPYYEQMKFLEHQKSLRKRRELYEQQNEKILEIYQYFPILWHVRHYKSRQAKRRAEAFESISKVLKLFGLHLSSLGVQKRIRSLRKCYRLEKIRHLHAQVEQTAFNAEFRHYERMQFLDKHIDPFVCRICGKIFENLQGFREHLDAENHGSILQQETDNDNVLDEDEPEENTADGKEFAAACGQTEYFTESENSTDILQRFTPFCVTPATPTENNYAQSLDHFPLTTAKEPSLINSWHYEDQLIEQIMENVNNNDSFSQHGLDEFITSVTSCEELTNGNSLFEEVLTPSLLHAENSFIVEHPDIISGQNCSLLSPLTNAESLISVDFGTENSLTVEHSDLMTDHHFSVPQPAEETVAVAAETIAEKQDDLQPSVELASPTKELENLVTAEVIVEKPSYSTALLVKVQCADYSVNLKLNTEPLTNLNPSQRDSDNELNTSCDNSTAPLPDLLIHKMIELYRKFPQLWDPNHLDFNSRTLRRQAWVKLTAEFNSIVCKQLSWRTLHRKLTDYAKYYKKLLTEQGNYENLVNKWVFYEDFKFLDDVIAVNTELQRSVHHRDNNFKIISTYKSFPQLWNIQHPDFSKRSCKQRNIELMCNKLQEENNLLLTTERLKNRLIELRAQYRSAKKQRLKCAKNQQQFSAAEFEFYEALNFLDDHIDPFVCDKCRMEFKKLTDYNRHSKKEHSPKKRNIVSPSAEHGMENVCHICGIKFTTRSNLLHHIKRHEGIRNYACTMCPKRFYASHALKVHTRSHTKECPYTCEKCGMSFVSASKLNQHVKRHLNQKDFECSYCPKTFFTAFEKDRHERRHLNIRDKVCPICAKTFVAGSSYYAHLMLHSDTKRFECDKCDMKFAQYPGLFKHKKRHHT